MRYTIYLQDSWGRSDVGRFDAIDQAREAFEALRQDRWCNDDGTVRGLLLVEQAADGERVVASHSFQPGG